ncbi:LANO_0E12860g1_1 [Lachancea nothofagi CBS 11611]|uniref:LANO_0E12860g1_1 n=1 Tax=Lachancea nothofagi CBS 11611 TaxID=1266666 RepID=A0A1G4JYH8_9SACH|nr:LANO_0E12860g1_1 [Lachancea nothofagi CBS 11611]
MTVPKSAVTPGTGLAAAQTKNPSSWDPQDDVLLRHLKEIKKLGWKEIAQYFKNRTPNACQFRWRRLRSGNLKTVGKSPENSDDTIVGTPGANLQASQTVQITQTAPATVAGTAGQALPVPAPASASSQSTASLAGPVPVVSSFVSTSPAAGLPVAFKPPAVNLSQPALGYIPHQHLAPQPAMQPRSQSHSSASSDKFIKPRSYSHTVAPPSGFLHSSSASHLPIEVSKANEDENLGLIPKVLVRSRRASVAQQPPHMVSSMPTLSSGSNTSNLSVALNTTLNTSKLRKNSFSSRPRRSSFNMAPPDRIFSSPSRRGSVVQAPPSVASVTRRESFNNTNSRRGSAIQSRRESFVQAPFDRRESVSNYTDVPRPNFHSFAPATGTSLNQTVFSKDVLSWSLDEDKLLYKRQEKHLSLDELSILLPHRSEEEIQWRIGALDRRTSSSSSSPLDTPERSLTEDTAIEEEITAANDGGPRQPSQGIFDVKKEVSPSLSLSSDSNDREHSPVFSPHPINRDQSPATFDSSTKPGVSKPLDGSNYNCLSDLDGHRSHSYSTINDHGASTGHGAPLPSLNSLFKNIL